MKSLDIKEWYIHQVASVAYTVLVVLLTYLITKKHGLPMAFSKHLWIPFFIAFAADVRRAWNTDLPFELTLLVIVSLSYICLTILSMNLWSMTVISQLILLKLIIMCVLAMSPSRSSYSYGL